MTCWLPEEGWLVCCLLWKVLSPGALVPRLQTNPIQACPSSGLIPSPCGTWCRGSSSPSLGSGVCWAPRDKLSGSDPVRPATYLQPLLWTLAFPAVLYENGVLPWQMPPKNHPYINFNGTEKLMFFFKKLRNIPQSDWNQFLSFLLLLLLIRSRHITPKLQFIQ